MRFRLHFASGTSLVVTAFAVLFVAILAPSVAFSQEEDYKTAYDAYKEGDFATAVTAIDKAIEQDPKSRKYHFLKALIMMRQSNDQEAIEELLACRTLKPNDCVATVSYTHLRAHET